MPSFGKSPGGTAERLGSSRAKEAGRNLISHSEVKLNKKIDILVGTQMVTKGLDFENVNLVGILNADALLSYPDFRAYEQAYQRYILAKKFERR